MCRILARSDQTRRRAEKRLTQGVYDPWTQSLVSALVTRMRRFEMLVARVVDQAERRVFRGESVPNVEKVLSLTKALITPLRERWVVKVKNGPDLEVKGNILDHEYTIGEGRDKVAEVSKKWFRLRDTYGVSIDPGQDDVLILAVAVCIDEMAHGAR